MSSYPVLGLGATLTTALRSGLLGALVSRSGTAEELAQRLGLHPRATRLVLDVLVADQLALLEGGSYSASFALREIDDRLPGGLQQEAIFWSHLESFLKTGESLHRMDAAPEERSSSYQRVVSGLARLWEREATKIAQALPVHPARILDVGCGAGVWSLAVAQRSPDAHVTGLDFPAVLDAFRQRARELGLEQRTSTLPGNMHEVEIPRGVFDLVIVANVLRLETDTAAAELIGRLSPALRPGGTLLIIDALGGDSPTQRLALTLYALHLGMRTVHASPHPIARLRAWTAAAGLPHCEALQLELEDASLGALLATASPVAPVREDGVAPADPPWG
jgi:ubiquinone/menaquinone biosynthesis C-methylase UbiE